MNLHKNYGEQNVHGRRRVNNFNDVGNENIRENGEINRMNFATKGNNIMQQWNVKSVNMNEGREMNKSTTSTTSTVIPDSIFQKNPMKEHFSNERTNMSNMMHKPIAPPMNYGVSGPLHTLSRNDVEPINNRITEISDMNGINGMMTTTMGRYDGYSQSSQGNEYISKENLNYETPGNLPMNTPPQHFSAHPILGSRKKTGGHNNISGINYEQRDFRNDKDFNNDPMNSMMNKNVSNERNRFNNEPVRPSSNTYAASSSYVMGNNVFPNATFSTRGQVGPSYGQVGAVPVGGVGGLYTNNRQMKSERVGDDLQFINRVIDEEEDEKGTRTFEERNEMSRRHLMDNRYGENRLDFQNTNKMNITGKMENASKINSNMKDSSRNVANNTNKNTKGSSGGSIINNFECTGLVKNMFDTLTGSSEVKGDLNNIVKEKVANMVMTEIEKKIDTADTSYLNSILGQLRQYFDVTHSYVLNKIFFIIMPYYYIYKALVESRTYYVYAHFKKKLEAIQKDTHLNSSNVFNHNNDLHMSNKSFKYGRNDAFFNMRNDKNDTSCFTTNMNNNMDNIGGVNNMNNMNNYNHINNKYNSNNNNNKNNNNKNNMNTISNELMRNNSNDINYVDYTNIRLFKADLYIPLMSVITYILLYTLTVTAQKNNFIFNPDNLFNISSYIFLLLLFEATVVKMLFLIVCRDINLSFMHILSFISYKFVIMCALIITKISFYFIYFMYMCFSDRKEDILGGSVAGVMMEEKIQPTVLHQNKRIVNANVNSTQVFKNMNVSGEAFTFNLYNLVVLLNSKISYRLTQFYFSITVCIQMLQIFKSIHLYIHDNSNLLNNNNIRRINVLILIFSVVQIFLCWILTPSFV